MIARFVRDAGTRHQALPWLGWAVTFFLSVWFIRGGQLYQLATLVVVGYVGVLILRWPMAGLVLLIVGFAGTRENIYYLGFLPSYRFPLIGTIYATDVCLAFTFLAGVRALAWRGEKPLFLKSLLILFGCALISNLNGMIAGDVAMWSFRRGFRNYLMYYTIYLAAVGVVDTRRKLHVLVAVPIILVVYGVWAQFGQLSGPASSLSGGWGFTDVAGRPVIYSRPGGVIFLVMLVGFLSLGPLVEGRRVPLFLLVGTTALASLLLALVRQIYIMLLAGGLAFLFPLSGGRAQRIVKMGLAILAVVVLLLAISPLMEATLGDTALATIVDRGAMILLGTKDPTIGSRSVQFWVQLRVWLMAPNPLLGYGFFAEKEGAIGETGFPNTLVLLGLFGLLAILNLWRNVASTAFHLCQALDKSIERGYVLGTFAFWCAILVGYALTQNFFLYPCIEVPLAMTFVDRVHSFAGQGLVPTRRKRPECVG